LVLLPFAFTKHQAGHREQVATQDDPNTPDRFVLVIPSIQRNPAWAGESNSETTHYMLVSGRNQRDFESRIGRFTTELLLGLYVLSHSLIRKEWRNVICNMEYCNGSMNSERSEGNETGDKKRSLAAPFHFQMRIDPEFVSVARSRQNMNFSANCIDRGLLENA
jgi:hypothetical protein